MKLLILDEDQISFSVQLILGVQADGMWGQTAKTSTVGRNYLSCNLMYAKPEGTNVESYVSSICRERPATCDEFYNSMTDDYNDGLLPRVQRQRNGVLGRFTVEGAAGLMGCAVAS